MRHGSVAENTRSILRADRRDQRDKRDNVEMQHYEAQNMRHLYSIDEGTVHS